MDPSTVRLIPNVFDLLFYYIAPADAVAYGNAYTMFGPIAYRQVRYRLASPKKGMLLLAWPFCMHSRDAASNSYKQVEFYDILRTNVMHSAGNNHSIATNVDDKMREFLAGFESLMLECVLSNTDFYADLNVLMLIFHHHDHYMDNKEKDYRGLMVDKVKPFQTDRQKWFISSKPSDKWDRPSLLMNCKLWGNAIDAVLAQCAPTLRHLVFVNSFPLSFDFYFNLKLDCMLAQLQQLETLYMPSIVDYKKAHYRSVGSTPCWPALHALPIEKRLPNLRRIVVDLPNKTSDILMHADVFSVLVAFGNSSRSDTMTDSHARLPQFRCLTPKLAVEALGTSELASSALRDVIADCTNINYFVRLQDNLTHRFDTNLDFMDFPKNSPEFISSVQKSVLDIVNYRPQMQSVINDVKSAADSVKVPMLLSSYCMNSMETDTVELLLNTLSCQSNWPPLSLTLDLDWNGLLKHAALFMTTSMLCFSRGVLTLKLTIENGLRYKALDSSAQSSLTKLVHQSKTFDIRYAFPPQQVTIEFRPPLLMLKHGEHDDYMPSIRKYFTDHLQQFIEDVSGGDKLINDADDSSSPEPSAAVHSALKNLGTDLYASCHKFIFIIDILYLCPAGAGNMPTNYANLRRIESLVHDKRFEQEMMQLLCKPVAAGLLKGAEPQFVMPSLKSISILPKVSEALITRRKEERRGRM